MKNILIYQENICWNLLIVYLAALSEHTVIIVEIIQYKLKKRLQPVSQALRAVIRDYHIIFKKNYINVTRQRGKEFFKSTKK